MVGSTVAAAHAPASVEDMSDAQQAKAPSHAAQHHAATRRLPHAASVAPLAAWAVPLPHVASAARLLPRAASVAHLLPHVASVAHLLPHVALAAVAVAEAHSVAVAVVVAHSAAVAVAVAHSAADTEAMEAEDNSFPIQTIKET